MVTNDLKTRNGKLINDSQNIIIVSKSKTNFTITTVGYFEISKEQNKC